MNPIVDYDLKEPDIEFLVAVRDLLQNPQDYDNTDTGQTAANARAIREATTLSKTQVDYRVKPGDNRGFTEDGIGLVRSHAPTVEGGGFGPRSVDLTDKGRKVVDAIDSQDLSSGSPREGAASTEEIAALQEQVSELSDQVENISGYIGQIQGDPTGALDEQQGEALDAIKSAVPIQQAVLDRVLDVDLDHVRASDPDELEVDRLRREIATALLDAADNQPSESDLE